MWSNNPMEWRPYDHSCEPSTWLDGLNVVARRPIAVGEALTLVCADEAPQLAAIETLIGKQLPRREVEGFEPKHRVPATGPNKHPPARPAEKGRSHANAMPAKKKKKKTAGGKAAAPTGGRRARQKPRPG